MVRSEQRKKGGTVGLSNQNVGTPFLIRSPGVDRPCWDVMAPVGDDVVEHIVVGFSSWFVSTPLDTALASHGWRHARWDQVTHLSTIALCPLLFLTRAALLLLLPANAGECRRGE